MNNIKKVLSQVMFFSLLTCGVFSIALIKKGDVMEARAETVVPTSEPGLYDEDHCPADFSKEVELDYDELDVSINQSNITATSQAINLNFRARTSVGYSTAKANYVITITDNTFTYKVGNEDDKTVYTKDHTNFNEDGIPIFKGNIFLIIGGNENNKKDSKRNVYIPSIVQRLSDVYKVDEEGKEVLDDKGEKIKIGDAKKGDFIVEIDSIAANAVTDNGAQYKSRNKWSKVSNIYIPSTVTEIDADAFCSENPDSVDAKIWYEGDTFPSTFVDGWTNLPSENVIADPESYIRDNDEESLAQLRTVNTSLPVTDLEESENYILGSLQSEENPEEKYHKPLTVQFDIVNKKDNSRKTWYDVLPLDNDKEMAYDSVGEVSSRSYSRTLGYKLAQDEEIDDESIIIHNIIKCDAAAKYDPEDPLIPIYYAKPRINYSVKQSIDDLVTFRASSNATFLGYSLFTLNMDKVDVPANETYNFEHSLYLDVMSSQYKQHEKNIKDGLTHIRYSLYNLYKSSYYFEYIGKGGERKSITVPVSTTITYQVLNQKKNNKVGVLLKDSSVAPDFNPNKVLKFELKDINIQMDLQGTSSAGTVVSLGNKSSISYRFAYLTIFDREKGPSVFNWNIFLIIIVLAYIALYTGGSFITFKIMKERFKNDEFRRVNNKKFAKSAILGGLGSIVVLLSALFIIMRTIGFRNTIVVFNPVDPLLIVFTIAAAIIIGYFIVYLVKTIKANQERRKAIRLRLNEDVDDDGTN